MPRRNQRGERHEPLDLTPADIFTKKPAPQPIRTYAERMKMRDEREARERDQRQRQRRAAINGGIDWSVCLVPGCGEELRLYALPQFRDPASRDHTRILPLCVEHELVVWRNVQTTRHDSVVIETNDRQLERLRQRDEQEAEAEKQRRLASQVGHIYFVRLNGLVKVGWSRDVQTRLRAYGPLADVLCIYPGTRQDETTLHRQLRPVLARGREWYEDGRVIQGFVAEAIERHGEPSVYDSWTKPKQVIRPRKRVS